ncbi:MAG: hypothetical protein SFY70_12925 [Bacteroidia bacterium]|nr:hypothetical protein [Bacteroidia bacterium]
MTDFTFKPGVGLGVLDLGFTPEQVTEHLGQPESVEEIVSDDNANNLEEKTVSYEYPDQGLSLQFFYYDNIFEGYQIFAGTLTVGGKNWFELPEAEVLAEVRALHKAHGKDVLFQRAEEEGEVYLFYPNLGLTLWFEGGELTDSCISAVLTAEQLDDMSDEFELEK